MEITVVDVPEQTVIGIRKRGGYDLIPQLLGELCQHAEKNGVKLTGMPTFICHETSPAEVEKANAEKNADVEVAFPVAGKVRGGGDVRCYALPGGRMARMLHEGPYKDCGPAYEELFAWLARNGKRVSGPLREVYLNDPRVVGEQKALTEILAPIQ